MIALELDYEKTPEQINYYRMAADPRNKEVMDIRSRGGSKSKDNTEIGLYFAQLGFAWVHYTAQLDQTKQPQRYLHELVDNSFLRYKIKLPLSDNYLKNSVVFDNSGVYELMNATIGKGRSRRVDGAYFDEERDMDEDAYLAILGTLGNSHLGKMIHGSTTEKGSLFHKNYESMMARGLQHCINYLPYDKVSYINKSYVEEIIQPTMPAWFFRQEYKCTWESPMGKCFENVIEGSFAQLLSTQLTNYNRNYVHFGLDWNPSAGHYISGTRWLDNFTGLVVLYEENLGTDLQIVVDRIITLLELNPHSYLEVEDGGTNAGYCDSLFMELYKRKSACMNRVFRRPWDSAGKNKMKSITNLITQPLYIDKKLTPETFEQTDKAHWDKTNNDFPKLEKDPDQHPLDAMLHSGWIGRYGV